MQNLVMIIIGWTLGMGTCLITITIALGPNFAQTAKAGQMTFDLECVGYRVESDSFDPVLAWDSEACPPVKRRTGSED
jgi:hypothetical protein